MPQPEKMPTPADGLRRDLSQGSPEARVHAYGELSRRRRAWNVTDEELRQGLAGVDVACVERIVAGVDAAAVTESLRSGAARAFDAAFAESDAEAKSLRGEACQALEARDALESTRVTAAALAAAGVVGARELASRLDGILAGIDAAGARLGRELSGANPERRKRADGLGTDERARAYWFTSFAEVAYDGLLAGLGAGDASGATTTEVRGQIDASRLPAGVLRGAGAVGDGGGTARDAAVSSALYRASQGAEGDAERTFADALGAESPAVAQAFELARERSEDDAG